MLPKDLDEVLEETEELSTVCEQGMYGELEVEDPTEVKVEK